MLHKVSEVPCFNLINLLLADKLYCFNFITISFKIEYLKLTLFRKEVVPANSNVKKPIFIKITSGFFIFELFIVKIFPTFF